MLVRLPWSMLEGRTACGVVAVDVNIAFFANFGRTMWILTLAESNLRASSQVK
jgi:type IV secretory pathway TrbD component